MQGYLIDAGRRKIEPIEYEYRTMREYLPGGICIGIVFPNRDVLFVDDEALLRPASVAFRIKRRPDGQPMMSNGILTGPDDVEGSAPPTFTIDQLQREIEWLDLDQALAWFRDKAAEPAVTSHRAGDAVEQVHAFWGDLLRNLEGEGGYRPDTDKSLIQRLG